MFIDRNVYNFNNLINFPDPRNDLHINLCKVFGVLGDAAGPPAAASTRTPRASSIRVKDVKNKNTKFVRVEMQQMSALGM